VQSSATLSYDQSNVSLRQAKKDTSKLGKGVLYAIQWDDSAATGGCATNIYIGETINNLSRRYGKMTTGLGQVLTDKDDAADIKITTWVSWDATNREDEDVARNLVAKKIAGVCVTNIRGMGFFLQANPFEFRICPGSK